MTPATFRSGFPSVTKVWHPLLSCSVPASTSMTLSYLLPWQILGSQHFVPALHPYQQCSLQSFRVPRVSPHASPAPASSPALLIFLGHSLLGAWLQISTSLLLEYHATVWWMPMMEHRSTETMMCQVGCASHGSQLLHMLTC